MDKTSFVPFDEIESPVPPNEEPHRVILTPRQSTTIGGTAITEAIVYPTGPRLALLLIALMLAVFMMALDTNVIGTAIPRITSQFQSLNDVGWYGSAYLLTLMTVQPTFGKIYTFFTQKWVFLVTLLVFEVGSVVCATAPSSPVFIVGRALSGCGASGIYSGGLALVSQLAPVPKRPFYISLIMSMYGVSAVAGPVLGGLFTDSSKLTWRFCFYINLPIGFITVILCFFLLDSHVKAPLADLPLRVKFKKMDVLGTATLIISMVLLVLALKWGGIDLPWSSTPVVGCLVGSVTGILIFIISIIYRREGTLISTNLLSQRNVVFAALFACFLNMGIDTHIYYLPLYFQTVDEVSASSSGIRMLVYLGSMIVAAVVSGSLISVLGYYVPFMTIGAALFTAGSALIATFNVKTRLAQWVGYQLLTGIGFGLSFQVPYSALQLVLVPEDLQMGNAIVLLFQTLGGALAVSIGQNVLSSELLSRLSTDPQITNPAAIALAGPEGFHASVSTDMARNIVEAYSFALSRTYVLPIVGAGLACLCSFGMEWRSVKEA